MLNAFLRDDAEPQLVLAFFGFPVSWIFFSIFDPLLEWLGPFGYINRRIAEWSLLGVAGVLQYWVIGAIATVLIRSKNRKKHSPPRTQ